MPSGVYFLSFFPASQACPAALQPTAHSCPLVPGEQTSLPLPLLSTDPFLSFLLPPSSHCFPPAAAGDDAAELAALPAALRAEIVWRTSAEAFAASRLLRCLPAQALALLASRARPVRVTAGGRVTGQGQPAECCYLLQAGEVSVVRGWRQVAVVAAPALLGQGALVPALLAAAGPGTDGSGGGGSSEGAAAEGAAAAAAGAVRAHTLTAEANCTMWELRAADVAMVVADDPPLLRAVAGAYLAYLEALPPAQQAWGGAAPLPGEGAAPAALPAAAAVGAAAAAALPPQAAGIHRALRQLLAPAAAAAEIPTQLLASRARQQQQQQWSAYKPQQTPSAWLAEQWVEAAVACFMQEEEGSATAQNRKRAMQVVHDAPGAPPTPLGAA